MSKSQSCVSLCHNLTQGVYLRPQNRRVRYRNLYFVGGSTYPGTGLPMVLISARLTTERVLQECGQPQTVFHPILRVSAIA